MAPADNPAPPPWRRGEKPSVDQRNFYERYLLLEIENRDLKHKALTAHIVSYCQ